MKCVSDCGIGSYYDGINGICNECGNQCSSCYFNEGGSKTCLGCMPGYKYNVTTKSCVTSCNPGDYEANGLCLPASGTSCSTVSTYYDANSNSCPVSCNNNLLIDSSVVKTCTNCNSKCQGSCLSSSDTRTCVARCNSGYPLLVLISQFNSLGGTSANIVKCESTLPSNYIYSSRTDVYYKCKATCGSCHPSSIYKCTSCSNSSDFLYDDGVCRKTCPSYMRFEESAGIKKCSTILSSSAKASSIITNIGSVLVPITSLATQLANPTVASASSRTQTLNMLLYLRYLPINYPTEIIEAYNKSSTSTFTFKIPIPTAWTEEDSNVPPKRYAQYGLSGLYLLNFFGSFITLIIILGLTGLFYLLERQKHKIQHKKPLYKAINFCCEFFIWNFIISFMTSNVGDATFFMFVQGQSLSGEIKGATIGSIIIGSLIVLSIIGSWLLILLPKLKQIVANLKLGKTSDQVEEEFGRFKVLFEEFKTKRKFQVYFLFIFSIRIILFNLFLTFPSEYPLVQVGMLLFLNLSMIIFSLVLRPFKACWKNIEIIFNEVCLMTANGIVAAIAVCDSPSIVNYLPTNEDPWTFVTNVKAASTTGLIAINFILTISSILFSALELIMVVFEVLKSLCKKRGAKVTPESKQGEPEQSQEQAKIAIEDPQENPIEEATMIENTPLRSGIVSPKNNQMPEETQNLVSIS